MCQAMDREVTELENQPVELHESNMPLQII
jgi:hypothetical protein